jgi:hypothetical protein
MKSCWEVNGIASVRDRFMSFFLRYASFFEPLALFGISYYLNQKLKQYKRQGRISTYKTHTKRLGKWHYKIEVDVDVTARQTAFVFAELSEQLKGLRR